MQKSVFDYRDYKTYLRDRVKQKGRGEKSRIAGVLRCHLAYVSQVLNGEAQFSLEQSDQLNDYLAHSEDESEYFLLLVSHARAGTHSLRKKYGQKIQKTLDERLILENRLKLKKTLPMDAQATYYSAWYYSAIHLLLSIPAFQTRDAIARHLRLPVAQITRALEFLVSTGLAEYAGGRYRTGQVSLHLKVDSPWTSRHHVSWRMQSAQAVEKGDPRNFHYTSVVSMAESDVNEARAILVEAIEKVRAVVRKSPEESIYCYTLDFFGV